MLQKFELLGEGNKFKNTLKKKERKIKKINKGDFSQPRKFYAPKIV